MRLPCAGGDVVFFHAFSAVATYDELGAVIRVLHVVCKSNFCTLAHLARAEFFQFFDTDALPAPMRHTQIAPFPSGSLVHVNIIGP